MASGANMQDSGHRDDIFRARKRQRDRGEKTRIGEIGRAIEVGWRAMEWKCRQEGRIPEDGVRFFGQTVKSEGGTVPEGRVVGDEGL
jgi:hypothetical protein